MSYLAKIKSLTKRAYIQHKFYKKRCKVLLTSTYYAHRGLKIKVCTYLQVRTFDRSNPERERRSDDIVFFVVRARPRGHVHLRCKQEGSFCIGSMWDHDKCLKLNSRRKPISANYHGVRWSEKFLCVSSEYKITLTCTQRENHIPIQFGKAPKTDPRGLSTSVFLVEIARHLTGFPI